MPRDDRILIGTNNEGKFIEIADVLRPLSLTLLRPSDLGISADCAETGTTFAENALQKARRFRSLAGLPTIADDSGIVVDALRGELGVRTRRWGAGPAASDDAWIRAFLRRMEGEPNRRARFVCAIAFIDREGRERTFDGTCEGAITGALQADYLPGLPISACFIPDGYDRVFSALNIEQKNDTSHRGKAARKLYEYLSAT